MEYGVSCMVDGCMLYADGIRGMISTSRLMSTETLIYWIAYSILDDVELGTPS